MKLLKLFKNDFEKLSMLQVSNISKEFSGKPIFNDVSFNVSPGERVGLVGRNGSGKSTLLKIIADRLVADSGKVQLPKDYSVGFLEQFIKFTEKTLVDECILSLPIDERHLIYKAEKILSGLGFEEGDFEKDPHSFSGGMQLRINLCKCLLAEPKLLLLDEPTNYLDITGIKWLTYFLRRYSGEVILITHDKFFMDSVATHVVGLYRGSAHKIKGSTKNYYAYINEQDEIHENTRANQDRKKKEIELFVDRFKAKASKASQAQSRVKMLERMEDIKVLPKIPLMSFRFNQKGFNARAMVTAKDLSFSYSADNPLFDNLSFAIDHKDRIAIMGANGKGKSTLLKVIADELASKTGSIKTHHNVSIGFFGQTNIERLHGNNTIVQEIGESHPGVGDSKIRSICGSMLFSSDDALKKIKVLSGGEKSRVMLGKIIASPCNLLLLDEPTNHFDQESIEVLIKELQSFDGAVVFVTHSEHFTKQLATKMIVFNENECTYHQLNYTDFLDRYGWDNKEKIEVKKQIPRKSYKEIKKLRSEINKQKSLKLKPLKEKHQQLEGSINELDLGLTTARNELIQASENSETQKIVSLSKEISIKEKTIEDLFTQLEEVDLELETQQNIYTAQLEKLNS